MVFVEIILNYINTTMSCTV